MPNQAPILLSARDISKLFPVGRHGLIGSHNTYVRAVAGVSLDIHQGETLGLVGESGCGKSTLARLLALLYPPDGGSIELDGVEVSTLSWRRLKNFRRRVQMVFQDPFSSLNPRLPVSMILSEPLIVHRIGSRAEQRRRTEALLDAVGLSAHMLNHYPHEFSGGQRQRIAIARALALEPELIIADESVSALDVSVQSQILNLLADLQQRLGLAYLFISHDLAVIDHLADRVAVMYLGHIVETAPREELFQAPAHPYTQALIDSVPGIRIGGKRRSGVVMGDVPSPLNPPSGCPYHPRCPRARRLCTESMPELEAAAGRPAAHRVACHFPLESRPSDNRI
jgi:oligopeptide/dipeptide ABC transporter ATP-binding protein